MASCSEKVDTFRGRLFVGMGKTFGALGKAAGSPAVSAVFAMFSIILFGVAFSGLFNHYREETSVTALYVQKGTRLEDEYNFHKSKWGISGNQFAALTSLSNPNGTANTAAMEAFKMIMRDLVKYNESEKCGVYDGTPNGPAIEAQCALMPDDLRKNMLYCMDTCQDESGYNHQPVGFVEPVSGKYITERDLCDDVAPADSATAFAPSSRASMPITEAEFTLPIHPYNQTLAALQASSASLTHHSTNADAMTVLNDNYLTWTAVTFNTIVATVNGGGTIPDGVIAATGVLYTSHTTAAYASVTGDALLRANLTDEATSFITGSVSTAIAAGTSGWLPESLGGNGNIVAWGYQEIASCAARNIGGVTVEQWKAAAYTRSLFEPVEYVSNALQIGVAESSISSALLAGLGVSTEGDAFDIVVGMLPESATPTFYEAHGCPQSASPTAAPTTEGPCVPAAGDPVTTAALQGVVAYFTAGGTLPGSNLTDDVILSASAGGLILNETSVGQGIALALTTQALGEAACNPASEGELASAFVQGLRVDIFSDSEVLVLNSVFQSAIASYAATGSTSAAGIAYIAGLMAADPPTTTGNTSIADTVLSADSDLSDVSVVYNGLAASLLTYQTLPPVELGALVTNAGPGDLDWMTAIVKLGMAFVSGTNSTAAVLIAANDPVYVSMSTAALPAFLSCTNATCQGQAMALVPAYLHHYFISISTMLTMLTDLAVYATDPTSAVGKMGKYLQPTFTALTPSNLAALEVFATAFGTSALQTMIGAYNLESLQNLFFVPTVNFTARPLPRKWGIDRWPCTALSPLEIFREADVAYPYNLKQLSEISLPVYGYIAGASALGLTDCVANAVVQPGMDLAYSAYLGADYKSTASEARLAAECEFAQVMDATLNLPTTNDALSSSGPEYLAAARTSGAAAAMTYLREGGLVSDCGTQDIIQDLIDNDADGAQLARTAVTSYQLVTADLTLTNPAMGGVSVISNVQTQIAATNIAASAFSLQSITFTDAEVGNGINTMFQLSLALSQPFGADDYTSLAMAFVQGSKPEVLTDAAVAGDIQNAFNETLLDVVLCGTNVTCAQEVGVQYLLLLSPVNWNRTHVFFGAAASSLSHLQGLGGIVVGSGPHVAPDRSSIGAGLAQVLGAGLQLSSQIATDGLTPAIYTNLALAFMSGSGTNVTTSQLETALLAAIPEVLQCISPHEICNTCHGFAATSIVDALPECQDDVPCYLGAFGTFVANISPAGAETRDLLTAQLQTVMSALQALPALQTFATNFGTGVAGAMYLKSAAGGQLESTALALVGFGYRYRSTYGDHRTNLILNSTNAAVQKYKKQYMSTPSEDVVEVLPTVSDAVKAYYLDTDNTTAGGQRVGAQACILDKKFPDGSPLRGCLTAWSTSWVAPDLLMADYPVADAGHSVYDMGQNGLSLVRYMRAVLYAYAPSNPFSKDYIADYLNRTLDEVQMYDELHLPKEQAQSDYLKLRWNREPGTGFGPGEAYASERLDFAVDRSSSDVIREATEVEWSNLIICYVVMVLVIGLSMTSFKSNIESHFWLGIIGVLVIALAVLSTLGAAVWWFEIDFTPVASNVAPFIALGIGIDDMLVIAKAYQLAAKEGAGVSDVLQATMAEAGPSVTFTTLTNLFAFLVATTTPINVVRWFSEIMAISVVFNWVFLMFLFVPIMAVDTYRTKIGRIEFCCPRFDTMDNFSVTNIMEKYYGPFLMRTPVRIFVLVFFAAFFGIQLWQGIAETQIGIRNSDIMMSGTHQHDFYDLNERNFWMYPVDMTSSSEHFDSQQVQLDLLMGANNVAASQWIESVSSDSAQIWLHDIVDQVPVAKRIRINVTNPPAGCSGNSIFPTAQEYEVVNSTDFYPAFASYLGGTGALSIASFTCKNTTSDSVTTCFDIIDAYPSAGGGSQDIILTAVISSFYMRNQRDNDHIIDALVDVRERVDECVTPGAPHWTFAHGYTYLYWEQYIHSWEDLTKVVGYAMLAVIVTTFLFQFSLRSSLMIAVIVVMVVIELLGFIPEHGRLKLNAFSIVNLAIAVGMAIEFTAHIVHQFLAEPGVDRVERVKNALTFMGEPMIFGMVSSLISCAFLAASDTEFIRQYYFAMFFAMIVIASANGMILLPVLLSFMGDSPLINPEDTGSANKKQPDVENVAMDGFGFAKKKESVSGDNYLQVGSDAESKAVAAF